MTGNTTNPETGLTAAEADERLRVDGPNELPSSRRRGVGAIAYGVLSEPMLFLLLACGAIYLLLGDRQEAVMLLGFVFWSSASRSTRSTRRSGRSRRCATCRARARW